MPRLYSTAVMTERLSGLLGTKDLTDWESGFVESCQKRLADGHITSLTERQVETLERLHSKHFA
jgi:hypothetical protein